MIMRCTIVKVKRFAHLMYVILHDGRVVREWEFGGGFKEDPAGGMPRGYAW